MGRQLVRELLDAGWSVTALLLPGEADSFAFRDAPKVASVTGEINRIDAETIPEGGVVFHLAAQVHSVPKTEEQRRQFFTVNRDGTAAVAAAARERNANGFVFLSTIAVYGPKLYEQVCDEATDPAPNTPYAESKLEAERAAAETLGDGIPYAVLRPSVIYGPGDRGNFARLIRAVRNGRFVTIDGGNARKNTMYVKNLARILVGIAAGLRDGDKLLLNVADPDVFTMREIALQVAEAAGGRVKLLNLPAWLLRPAAWAGDALGLLTKHEMPLSSRRLGVMTSDSVVSTARLMEVLGERARFTPLVEGVRETIDAMDREESA